MVQDLAGGRLGSLAVAAAFPIANGFLAQAVATFMRARPGVRVTLKSSFTTGHKKCCRP